MQTWLAYALDDEVREDLVFAALDRVERHYARVDGERLVRRGSVGAQLGLVVWDQPAPACRWPAWAEDGDTGVATGWVPVGWRRVVGEGAGQAAVRLARALAARPDLVARLDPPFVVGILDRGARELTILNDGLGFARVFEMRINGGWVWSNRLGALPIFAGVAARPDVRAWESLAAAGWFSGDSTPIEGARLLPPNAVVRVAAGRPRRVAQGASIDEWTSPPFGSGDVLEETASALSESVADAIGLWSEVPNVSLSGGRDSRLVAAAVIATGLDCTLQTETTFAGEVETARQLVALLPRPIRHITYGGAAVARRGSLVERALALHAAYDGVHSPTSMSGMARATFLARPTLGGAAGELAHAYYYPRNIWDADLEDHRGLVEHLDRGLRRPGCASAAAHAGVRARIETVLEEGARRGLRGLALLDYFYMLERLRRWSAASARLGLVAPLLTPLFVRSSFGLSTPERRTNWLHRALTATLVPEWRHVPYFKPAPGAQPSRQKARMWETEDAAEMEEILAESSRWDDVFDAGAVRARWREVRSDGGLPRDEHLFQRVAARASFDDHLDRLRQAATATPPPVAVTSAPAAGEPLLVNARFDDGSRGWTLSAGRRSTAFVGRAEAGAPLVLPGAPGAVLSLQQEVRAEGLAGDALRLDVEASGAALEETGGEIAVHLQLHTEAGKWERLTLSLPAGTYPWRRFSATMRAPKPFDRVRVVVSLRDRGGSLALRLVDVRRLDAVSDGRLSAAPV